MTISTAEPPAPIIELEGAAAVTCTFGKKAILSWQKQVPFYLLNPSPPSIRIRPEAKLAWCGALRSGQWTQVRGEWGYGLHRCAMSVLFALVDVPISCRADGQLHRALADWLGVSYEQLNHIEYAVVQMNDRECLSFDEIADRIERDY